MPSSANVGPVRAGAAMLLILATAAGCASKAKSSEAARSAATSPPTSTSASSTAPSSSQAAPRTTPAASTTSAAPATSISIPPNLCAATDTAQNTADAYMGALSAGDEKEALDCVFGSSVPLSTTRSLLAHTSQTAVYLPKQGGADGPTAFDYVGAGKNIRVTVSRLADHHTWVTDVSVRAQ